MRRDEEPRAESVPPATMTRPRVLVIDDDANMRQTLCDILRVTGYEPAAASDGAHGIAAAASASVSVALIDLKLPDMSGIEVMERIKTASPLTEAIVLTGHASLDTSIEALKKGAHCYLLKPYQVEELLLHVANGVAKQRAQQEIVRLASFPRLTPNPIIEVDPTGAVTYVNPAAERFFPDLHARGAAHPMLAGLTVLFAAFQQEARCEMIVQDVRVSDRVYEQHVSYVPESRVLRIYAADITRRVHAEEELRTMAIRDSLTGIANRREFERVINREVARAKRYGVALSLVMFDLDRFKQINDTFGHAAGDTVLKAVTQLVATHLRDIDAFARWGGEEFVILAPHVERAGAEALAERVRRATAENAFPEVGTVTASFGVTSLRAEDDAAAFLARADEAMYQAKASGRNRVAVLS